MESLLSTGLREALKKNGPNKGIALKGDGGFNPCPNVLGALFLWTSQPSLGVIGNIGFALSRTKKSL